MTFMQKPDAPVVAGFSRWKSLGRSVKKGEKGVAIFAPCRNKTKVEDDDGTEKSFQQIRGLRPDVAPAQAVTTIIRETRPRDPSR